MNAPQNQSREVPEGNLAPGERPLPGPRPPRAVWTADPQLSRSESGSDPSSPWEPDQQSPPVPRRGKHKTSHSTGVYRVQSRDGRKTARRTVGIDAARGLAMIGMIAVHTLPALNPETGEPTWVWRLAAGHASALFALLAGMSLAFLTGSRKRDIGRDRLRSRVSLTVRALILLLFGLTLNLLPIPVFDILPYYGLLFLLAIPFTLLSNRANLVAAGVFAVVAPFVMQLSLAGIDYTPYYNADIADLAVDPGNVLIDLLLTGHYPAITWMTFICLGIALGRMPLNRERVQVGLVIVGAVLAAAAVGLSNFLLYRAGGMRSILEANPEMSATDVRWVVKLGPDPILPTTTNWWLVIDGPHTNTPFALAYSAGLAMVALGGFLLLSRTAGRWLSPIASIGTMTLTLYTLHMLFLAAIDISQHPGFWFFIQIAVAALIATAWLKALGRGPLEALMRAACRWAGRMVVPPGSEPDAAPATTPVETVPQSEEAGTRSEEAVPRRE